MDLLKSVLASKKALAVVAGLVFLALSPLTNKLGVEITVEERIGVITALLTYIIGHVHGSGDAVKAAVQVDVPKAADVPKSDPPSPPAAAA